MKDKQFACSSSNITKYLTNFLKTMETKDGVVKLLLN
jgi:hypothetical protein